jgi:hypothetical protein
VLLVQLQSPASLEFDPAMRAVWLEHFESSRRDDGRGGNIFETLLRVPSACFRFDGPPMATTLLLSANKMLEWTDASTTNDLLLVD